MKQFEKNKNYKIGYLRKDEDQSAPDPAFAQKPSPIVFNGSTLIGSGYKTLSDYLSSPDIPFSNNKVVHCFEIEENGYMNYFGAQTPLPKYDEPLNDSAKSGIRSLHNGNNAIVEHLQTEIQTKNKKIAELELKLENERAERAVETRERLEVDAEQKNKIIELKTELKTVNDFLDGLKKGTALDDNGGMGGKVMDFLNGPFGNILSNVVAHNPKVQESIGNLITKFDKATKTPGEPTNNLESKVEEVDTGVDNV